MAKARKAPKLKVVRGGKLTAVYRRDPEDLRFWLAHIAEDDRCHTFGRSFKQAQANLLDIASLWFEREISHDDLEETFDLPAKAQPWADGYARAEADLVRAERHRDAMRYGLIRELLDADISLRPSAQIVGTLGKNSISYQRVQQIATDPGLKALAESLSAYLPDGKNAGPSRGGPVRPSLKTAAREYSRAARKAAPKRARKAAAKKRTMEAKKSRKRTAKKRGT